MHVALMVTCLADLFRPSAAQATVQLLERLGHTVSCPPRQTCCGQPLFNSGYLELAREQARFTLDAFADAPLVVAPSASCAAMVKVEYPHLFEQDDLWHARAKELAERTWELSAFLVKYLGVLDVGARYEGRVGYHWACHLRGLGQSDEVEQLLRHVRGAEYVPLARQDQCCGFGGSFSVRYPHISTAMAADKVQCILAAGVDALVSTDTGCLMNIGGRLRRQGQEEIEVFHLAELLLRQ
jgi:L-lactate dehydrogenase complex protein LldE